MAKKPKTAAAKKPKDPQVSAAPIEPIPSPPTSDKDEAPAEQPKAEFENTKYGFVRRKN